MSEIIITDKDLFDAIETIALQESLKCLNASGMDNKSSYYSGFMAGAKYLYEKMKESLTEK